MPNDHGESPMASLGVRFRRWSFVGHWGLVIGHSVMLYLLFFAMLIGFVGALIALPAFLAPLVPWWGVVLIVVGELVVLRYTFFRILGLMFGVFVWAGLRVGVRGMRGAKVEVHSIKVV